MLLQQRWRQPEAPSKGAGFHAALTSPLRRAEHRSSGRKQEQCCLSASEFTARRPLREAQGSPQGRVLWAFSFGSVFFHAKENEQNAT